MRHVVAVIADEHGGSRLGLLNPETRLTDENGAEYQPTLLKTQEWLWESHIDAILETLEFANDDPIYLVHNGDICQGSKHGTVVSPLAVDQVTIALCNLDPWLQWGNVERLYLIEGTQAHDFTGGTAEKLVLQALKDDLYVRYTPHLRLRVEEALFDIAHHGSHPGGRVWLRGNPARFDLRDAMLSEILRGQPVPNLYVRAHYHQPIDELTTLEGGHSSRVMIVPSWQAADQFVRKVAKSPARICCGMAAIEVIDGQIGRVIKPLYEQELWLEEVVTTNG